MAPLVWAPLLPIIRIVFRKNERVRVALFGGVLAAGFLHGAGTILFDLDLTSSPERRVDRASSPSPSSA
jgi:hypothetical protein